MCTSVSCFYRTQVSVLGRFSQYIRQYSAFIFFFAFFLFTTNAILSSATANSKTELVTMGSKWTAAYRSLEKALGIALKGGF